MDLPNAAINILKCDINQLILDQNDRGRHLFLSFKYKYDKFICGLCVSFAKRGNNIACFYVKHQPFHTVIS